MKESFAVIKLSGNQHIVKPGDQIEVRKVDVEVDKTFDISEVLLTNTDGKVVVGTPFVEKTVVTAKVIKHFKGEKVVSSTFKAKSRQRRRVGSRQNLSLIEIVKIS